MYFRDLFNILLANNLSSLQERLDAVNVDKSVDYVVSCMNFDGGFGCRPGSESHSGQVGWSDEPV